MGERPLEGEKVLLFFHGGGYTALSAHPDAFTSNITKSILQHCDRASLNIRRAFQLEYRLSSHDPKPRENPFPAALLDALAGYVYLVNEVGFAPKDIIVVGDSAGGNLALVLTRYITAHLAQEDVDGLKLDGPGGLILLSPWTDLGFSHSYNLTGSEYTNAVSDMLTPSEKGVKTLSYPVLAFIGPNDPGIVDNNAYVSPASLCLQDEQVSFDSFPPTFLVSGDAEMLLDQIRTLERRMRTSLGDNLVYYEANDAVHDYTIFNWHEPQRTDTMIEITKWLARI